MPSRTAWHPRHHARARATCIWGAMNDGAPNGVEKVESMNAMSAPLLSVGLALARGVRTEGDGIPLGPRAAIRDLR